MISLGCLSVFPRRVYVKCRLCLHASCCSGQRGVDSHRGEQCFPKLGLTPFFKLRAPPSLLGSSVCCRVRQAMGLCVGFAVADFKPICWGKIGLVYHPSFIVHIVFVNPSNYISPCCCHAFLPLFSFFLPTQANRSRQKQKALLQ